MSEIHIAAAIIVNSSGETLLVRKRNTRFFMQAGGKIDGNESPAEALRRELEEELGLSFEPNEFKALGRFESPAANEADRHMKAELFLLEADFSPKPASEISEAIWCMPEVARGLPLAPLTRDHVMPIVENCIGQ